MKKSVAVAFVDRNKILMQHRDNKSDIAMPGRWGLPGGLVEENETPKQAIKREFLEETGYQLKNPQVFTKYFYNFNNKRVIGYIFYEAYDGKQKIKCQEGQKIEFKFIEEIKKLNLVPRHDEFALKAISLSQD